MSFNYSNLYFDWHTMSNRLFNPPSTRWWPRAIWTLATCAPVHSVKQLWFMADISIIIIIYLCYLDITGFIHQQTSLRGCHLSEPLLQEFWCPLGEFANQSRHLMRVRVVKFPLWRLKNHMLGGVNSDYGLLNRTSLIVILLWDPLG